MLKLKLLAVAGLMVSGSVLAQNAEPPTAKAVLISIMNHHPKLLELKAKSGQRLQTLRAAEAAFDISLEQETNLRTSGYYSGDYATQRVVKPLGVANAKLKGEYRYADGNFPYYEREYPTLSGGEASVGLELSLLRNFDTDKKRMAIQDAKTELGQWSATRDLSINSLVYSGLAAYLDWYEAHLNVIIYENLMATTQVRGEAINKRVETGDLAEITRTEFNVTVMERRLALQQAKLKAAQSREKLAFYYRDSGFNPFPTERLTDVPQNIVWPWRASQMTTAMIKSGLNHHPILEELRADVTLAKNKLTLAKNDMLPDLNIEAKLARDLGSGPENLSGTETKVGLQFSMPLGRRAAKAKASKASLKVQELSYALQTATDSVTRDVNVALQGLNYAQSIAELRSEQANLAEQLFSQEQRRFQIGDSDLFLLNTREAAAINARLDAINAELAINRAVLAILYQTGMLADVDVHRL